MNRKEIIDFFDRLAPLWDETQERNEEVLKVILDTAGISKGARVLDVACGTGVLFPDYLSRGADIIGIDISAEMVKRAKSKFPQVQVICADAQSYCFGKDFDAVMIYNAFPHFDEPEKLFQNLSTALKGNGRITVSHGMSEEKLSKCHSSGAKHVSNPLPSKEKLSDIMSPFFCIDVMVSDNEKYIVSGVKK